MEAFSVGLLGRLFAPQRETVASGSGGDFSLGLLELRGCLKFGEVWVIGACPSVLWGQERGKGIRVDQSLTATSRFWAAGATGQLEAFPTQWLSGKLSLQAVLPFAHDEFVLASGPIHQLPRVSLEIALGASARVF